MKTEDVINLLKTKKYSFELKDNQVIIRLARRYFLKLYVENGNVVKNEDMVKQFGLFSGKSLKVTTQVNMIAYLIFSLPFVALCIFDPYFFSTGGKYFIIMIITVISAQLIDFWYNHNRLSKIKKLLNLND